MGIPYLFVILSITFALCKGSDVDGTEARMQRFAEYTKYYLYSRQNVHNAIELSADTLASAEINPALDTVVIIHGHIQNNDLRYEADIKNAFLQRRDHNVILVDWRVTAAMDYISAFNFVPEVAKNVATFLTAFSEAAAGAGNTTSPEEPGTEDGNGTPAPDETSSRAYGINGDELNVELYAEEATTIHIVGFGLGAHLAGIAARNLKVDVDRITALDPSGRNWGSNSARLSPSDAKYVEVIHTDGFGNAANGLSEPLGHVDFYPNGGRHVQPGCGNQICSHNRAWELFEATILNPGQLIGSKCKDLKDMEHNKCPGTKVEMGGIEVLKFASGIFRLTTRNVYPFV